VGIITDDRGFIYQDDWQDDWQGLRNKASFEALIELGESGSDDRIEEE